MSQSPFNWPVFCPSNFELFIKETSAYLQKLVFGRLPGPKLSTGLFGVAEVQSGKLSGGEDREMVEGKSIPQPFVIPCYFNGSLSSFFSIQNGYFIQNSFCTNSKRGKRIVKGKKSQQFTKCFSSKQSRCRISIKNLRNWTIILFQEYLDSIFVNKFISHKTCMKMAKPYQNSRTILVTWQREGSEEKKNYKRNENVEKGQKTTLLGSLVPTESGHIPVNMLLLYIYIALSTSNHGETIAPNNKNSSKTPFHLSKSVYGRTTLPWKIIPRN